MSTTEKSFLNTCPGLTGEIAAWMAYDAHKFQPNLAVAAALAVVGTLKAQRVKSQTNLRTNNYLIAVAPSGSGKNHPLEKAKILLAEAGATRLLMGQPTSDAGVVSALAHQKGVGLILWDEFGQALKAITTKGSSIELSIIKILTEMFSSAGSVFVSKSYADNKLNKKIIQPCLSLYASSTPERLMGALASGNVEDGFVGRFLFVPGESEPKLLGIGEAELSNQMLQGIKKILKARKFDIQPGDGDLEPFFEIRPKTVPYSPQAWDMIQTLQGIQDSWGRNSSELVKPIIARGLEHIIKIALTICNDEVITESDISWAHSFVTHSQLYLIGQAQEVMSAGDSKLLEEIIYDHILASDGPVTDQELSTIQSYSRAKLKVRKEARDSLIDKGLIQKILVGPTQAWVAVPRITT